jgi:hypothetical protein
LGSKNLAVKVFKSFEGFKQIAVLYKYWSYTTYVEYAYRFNTKSKAQIFVQKYFYWVNYN